MTVVRLVHIECEGEIVTQSGRTTACGETSGGESSVRDARENAKYHGFVRKNGKDLCSSCGGES